MDLHPNLAPFSFLIGTWSGAGRGYYPTIAGFEYRETVAFSAIPGKPFLRYEQKTQGAHGPMHTELGFFRPVGEGKLEFTLAQPTGQTELLEGAVTEFDGELRFGFEQSTVVNSRTAKEVKCTARFYVLNKERTVLKTRFDMAAASQELQQHLESHLEKQA